MNAFIITLSVFRTIFSWCLPLCVLCVILADYREIRRSNMTLAALRRHKESLAHYHIMSILMLCVTCITYWVVAGSPADMFFLSSQESNTPYFSVGLSQHGFPARMLFLPTFAVFISMMLLGFWSAAIGNGSKIGMYGLGSCLGAFVLTVLVLIWGEIGTRQRVRCERFCPATQECGCDSFWHITLPLVIIEFALILAHAGLTARVWKRVRGYASLDEKNVDVDMEAPEDRQETFDDDQHRLPQGTDAAAAYY